MSDDGTKAAKAIAHAVALEGALAHADHFVTQLRNFSLDVEQLEQLNILDQNMVTARASASLIMHGFYKVIGEGD